jgi:hypothetical protein
MGGSSMRFRLPLQLPDAWPTTPGEWLYLIWNIAGQLWDALPQGLPVLVGLGLVWWALRRENNKLGDRIDTLRQLVNAQADRDEEEAALDKMASAPQPKSLPNGMAPAVASNPIDNWQAVRTSWRIVRDRIELLIEDIASTRLRGKLSKMRRNRYRDIVTLLEQRGKLGAHTADTLRKMDLFFNQARFKPQGVSDVDVAKFVVDYQVVDRELPELPDGSGDDLPSVFRAPASEQQPRPAAPAVAATSSAA